MKNQNYNKTLVIDNAYIARTIISSARAFTIFYKGNAEIISNHPESFGVVNPELDIKKPSIIKVNSYVRSQHQKVPLNRENIYKRDDYTCVYCGSKDRSTFTLDHVIPQSQGGPNSWDNLVTACKRCNGEKADLSLAEYGKEIPVPHRPHHLLLMKNTNFEIPKSWKDFLFF